MIDRLLSWNALTGDVPTVGGPTARLRDLLTARSAGAGVPIRRRPVRRAVGCHQGCALAGEHSCGRELRGTGRV